jgi:hypothetical protein
VRVYPDDASVHAKPRTRRTRLFAENWSVTSTAWTRKVYAIAPSGGMSGWTFMRVGRPNVLNGIRSSPSGLLCAPRRTRNARPAEEGEDLVCFAGNVAGPEFEAADLRLNRTTDVLLAGAPGGRAPMATMKKYA